MELLEKVKLNAVFQKWGESMKSEALSAAKAAVGIDIKQMTIAITTARILLIFIVSSFVFCLS